MTKEEKEIQEIKKDIAKRLRLSDSGTWEVLSMDQQREVVDKYYHLFDIDKVGIHKVVEGNWNFKFALSLSLLGVLLGVLGGVLGNIIIKYLPSNIYSDLFLVMFFCLVFVFLMKKVERINIEELKEQKVLKYLVGSLEKDKEL